MIDEQLQLWTRSNWDEYVADLKQKYEVSQAKAKGPNEDAEIKTTDEDDPCKIPFIDISLNIRLILVTMTVRARV